MPSGAPLDVSAHQPQQLAPIAPGSPTISGWWHCTGSLCHLPFTAVPWLVLKSRLPSWERPDKHQRGSFHTLEGTLPPQHTQLCTSVTTQPSTSPWIPLCSRALVWHQADSTVMTGCNIYIFLPPSEKTSTKWPSSTWLLRGRAGGKPS